MTIDEVIQELSLGRSYVLNHFNEGEETHNRKYIAQFESLISYLATARDAGMEFPSFVQVSIAEALKRRNVCILRFSAEHQDLIDKISAITNSIHEVKDNEVTIIYFPTLLDYTSWGDMSFAWAIKKLIEIYSKSSFSS